MGAWFAGLLWVLDWLLCVVPKLLLVVVRGIGSLSWLLGEAWFPRLLWGLGFVCVFGP